MSTDESRDPQPQRAPLKAGDRLGTYSLVRPIGSGGMGAVFEAVHGDLGKRCAIKVLHDEYALNSKIVRRFFNEARAVARIRHENIIDVYDFGKTPDRYYYFVMELLEGISLADELKQLGRIELRRACVIVGQVARALAAVHAAGIVHRDLKPGNLFLTRRAQAQDFVKVLDFGIAKLVTKSQLEQTETGMVIGTTRYMAPEQCRGGKEVDHRADIYALATVFYGLVAGRLPFNADNPGDLVVQHLTETAPPLSHFFPGELPPALDAMVARALAKNPSDRYQSMDELADVLVPFGGPERSVEVVFREPAPSRSFDSDLDDTPPLVQSVRAPEPATSPPTRSDRPITAEVPRRRSRVALALPIVGVLAVAAAVALQARGRLQATARPTPPPIATPTPAPSPPPVAQAPRTVRVLISSLPAGARVLAGDEGTVLGETPFDWQPERADGQVRIRLLKDGFEPVDQAIVPNADQRLSFMLRPVVKSAPARHRSRPSPTSAAPDKPVRNDGLLAPSY